MKKSIKFYCNDDHIELSSDAENNVMLEVNYWPDEGSGVQGESISFALSEFEIFVNECMQYLRELKTNRG